jgi:hypothetical protein
MPSWTNYAGFGLGLFIVLHLIAFIRPHGWVSRRLHPSFPADPDNDSEFSVGSLHYNGVCDINHTYSLPMEHHYKVLTKLLIEYLNMRRILVHNRVKETGIFNSNYSTLRSPCRASMLQASSLVTLLKTTVKGLSQSPLSSRYLYVVFESVDSLWIITNLSTPPSKLDHLSRPLQSSKPLE